MPTIQELLQKSRNELLDLSTRNRLLSIPVNSKSARIIQVQDELSDQVYRLLTAPDKKDRKTFSFLPGRGDKTAAAETASSDDEEDDEETGLPQPDEEEDPSTGLAKRHVDSRLQTALSPEGLQRRLLALYRDARTMIEEQGVNILYLVLGHLKWFDAEQTETPRYAPLMLVPVELDRKSASERFVLRWTEDDIEENLSLRAKLATDFGIELPPFPDEEKLSVTKYFDAIAKAVRRANNWEVIPNAITLGFFSFAKFLMYRDLDPENWPEGQALVNQPFITGLLQDGFAHSEPLLADEANLDEYIPASRLDHVVDADSSQTLAIEAVRQGRSLVIQGPPGTGKSQSITNIIATAVLDGKRVLFVAEKLAALEVVKRRLEHEGLGDLCLELHSNKANKRAVSRIQDAVAKAIRSVLVTKRCRREDGFLVIPNAAISVRNRESVCSSTLRKPEMLPPAELRAAILAVIDAGHGAMSQEIPTAVARMLGFKATGAQLRKNIETQLEKLVRQEVIEQINGMLQRTQKSAKLVSPS